ncbi:unnamed protein product [Caenorhabditis sp. 36 PRJEB53466]|nr:unnamed protein product [Caenorhabditis sp. 36 PRJEB53466]
MFALVVPAPKIKIIDEKSAITFDRPSMKYYPGEKVSGTVRLLNEEPISARFLKISWKGCSKTNFGGIGNGRQRHFYNANVVWTSPDGKNKLPRGPHTFQFEFILPKECPPSFRGSYGRINYTVEVEMNRPWMADVGAAKTRPGLRAIAPLASFFKDGSFCMKVSLPQRAFLSGDTITASIELANHSSKAITRLEANLLQQAHYHHRPLTTPCSISNSRNCSLDVSNSADSERSVLKASCKVNVAPFSTKVIKVEVNLPDDLLATFQSPLISVGYLMCFSAKSESWSGNKLQCNARIAIGTLVSLDEKLKRLTLRPPTTSTPRVPDRFEARYLWDTTMPPPPYH